MTDVTLFHIRNNNGNLLNYQENTMIFSLVTNITAIKEDKSNGTPIK